MPLPVDAKTMQALSTQLCCVGVLLQSLELIWNWRELPDDRLLGWLPSPTPSSNPLTLLARFLYRYPTCLVVLALRAGAAGACLFLPYGSVLVCCLLGSLFAGQLYFNRRFKFVRANADTMTLVCLGAAFPGSLPSASPSFQAAALLFVAFQASVAYVMTGYDKLVSPLWRDGTRLVQIFRDGNFQFLPVGTFLAHHPRWAVACTWGVIVLELLFPLCVALPPFGFWALLAGGAIFHGAVAFTMRLHGFWWAFTATYPAFYFIHSRGFSLPS